MDNGFAYLGELSHGYLQNRMEHLVCYIGGNLALASQGAEPPELARWYLEVCSILAILVSMSC